MPGMEIVFECFEVCDILRKRFEIIQNLFDAPLQFQALLSNTSSTPRRYYELEVCVNNLNVNQLVEHDII